jgi:hypothetical protein
MSTAFVLDKRHSDPQGICDAHGSYVSKKAAVSKLLIRRSDGSTEVIRLCRPCARALASNASLKSEQ